jgi:hypothetical protein
MCIGSAFGALSVINQPDLADTFCNFRKYSKLLATGTFANFGLPDINQSYFKGSFTQKISCTSKLANFFYTRPNNAPSIHWDFGDPLSGLNNNSSKDSPSHVFTNPGTYIVKAIVTLPCRFDTLVKTISINPMNVNLGSDVTICKDSVVILNPQSGNSYNYLWQNNTTNATLTATNPGLYWVQVTNTTNGCVVRDSLTLFNKPNPIVDFGNDTVLCGNNSLLLNATNSGANYTWQDNSSNPTFLVKNTGLYFVKINLNGCYASDSINVQYNYKPEINFAKDSAICTGMKILLSPTIKHTENATYIWNTGETTPAITILQPGNYALTVANFCGSKTESILISPGVCKLYVPNAFTPNADGKNDFFKPSFGENVMD